MKNKTSYVTSPPSVQTSAVKKSVATRTSMCVRMNSFQVVVVWRWRDAMALEDVAHRLVTDRQAEVGQGADNPVIAPRAILLGHADNQGLQLWVDLRSSWSLALGGAVKFLRHKPAVPAKDRVRLDDGGHFRERLLAQLLANLGQGFALAITQAYATFDLVTQHAIFGYQVFVAEQQCLIDGPRDIRQQVFPVHQLPPQPVPSIGTLSMDKGGAEDKPKRGRWERRNFQWKSRFEYFDQTGVMQLKLGVIRSLSSA